VRLNKCREQVQARAPAYSRVSRCMRTSGDPQPSGSAEQAFTWTTARRHGPRSGCRRVPLRWARAQAGDRRRGEPGENSMNRRAAITGLARSPFAAATLVIGHRVSTTVESRFPPVADRGSQRLPTRTHPGLLQAGRPPRRRLHRAGSRHHRRRRTGLPTRTGDRRHDRYRRPPGVRLPSHDQTPGRRRRHWLVGGGFHSGRTAHVTSG
jgi:hypothetical protein